MGTEKKVEIVTNAFFNSNISSEWKMWVMISILFGSINSVIWEKKCLKKQLIYTERIFNEERVLTLVTGMLKILGWKKVLYF